MGDSDYRYAYDAETYAAEIVAVCDDAGFGNDVVVVAHSFGGVMATKAANLFSRTFSVPWCSLTPRFALPTKAFPPKAR